MLNFRKLTLSDAELLREKFRASKSRLCDMTLGGVMMWRDYFETCLALDEDTLFFRVKRENGETAFTLPIGDVRRGLMLLKDYCAAQNIPLVFCTVGEEEQKILLDWAPNAKCEETRDWFDYVYEKEKLLTFAGKKLAGQRNHRNFFLREHKDWTFEEITPENTEEVRAFFASFNDEVSKPSDTFAEEEKKVFEVLDNQEVYGFFGGVIRADGKIVAMSLGEAVYDTLFVHIEKASRSCRGAYQMMVSEFIRHFASDEAIRFVNREEDVGDLGLRKSKTDYHPVMLLKKFIVSVPE